MSKRNVEQIRQLTCRSCGWLRDEIAVATTTGKFPNIFGGKLHPCYRYPQSVIRSINEPACGEHEIA